MNRVVAIRESVLRPLQVWGSRLVGLLTVVGLGWLLGTQYVNPDKRVLAVMASVVMAGIAWRIDVVSGLGVLLFALLYPRTTVFGNTNFALVLLLLVMWLMRVSFRQIAAPQRTALDLAIGGFLIALIVSFHNVEPELLGLAFSNFEILIVCFLMYYLIVNNIHTSRDLERLHIFQLVAIASACLFTVYELNHPGGTLIPGWITFESTKGTEFDAHNIRVGGPFRDFELMSEYSALSLLLVIFMFVRASSRSRRLVYGSLGLLVTFVLFATVSRGAIFALGAGAAYALWIFRRRLRLVPMVLLVTFGTALFLGMNYYVSHFTRSGDLMGRLEATKFYGGVPDSRVVAWQNAWERFLLHPIIGNGLAYTNHTGVHIWYWPHNVYLYVLNIVGVVGFVFYLLLLWRLVSLSRPMTDDMRDANYARAFLTIGHIQLVVFMVDQIKIDFLRNQIYQFQPWLLFASLVAAHRVATRESAAPMPMPMARPLASGAH